MSTSTSIEWTDRTWNPTRGCRRVSAGCENCYAERQANRFSGKGGPYEGLVKLVGGKPRWTGVGRLVPHALIEPLKWRAPARVFVDSMSDLFFEAFSNEDIAAVFGIMAAAKQHTFQVLTKRPKRMREWFEWIANERVGEGAWRRACTGWYRAVDTHPPLASSDWDREFWKTAHELRWPLPNVWLGVSVENQTAADERIPELLATPAVVRFLSCEPLIGRVNLRNVSGLPSDDEDVRLDALDGTWTTSPRDEDVHELESKLDWVIAGCESGPGARGCDVAWLRSLRDQCAAAGTAFFLKQAHESDVGRCGDVDNPNGDDPCGERIRVFVNGPGDGSWTCGCTAEGPEFGTHVDVGAGDGSKRKSGGVIALPYLDGVQYAEFPRTQQEE